jgi:hypothetical protein
MADATGEWVQVRMRREVHAELVQVRDAIYRNRTGESGRSCNVPSLNDAVEELLRRYREHRRRGRKASDGRKALRRAQSTGAIAIQDDTE